MALSKFYHASNLIFHVSIIGKKHTYSLFFFTVGYPLRTQANLHFTNVLWETCKTSVKQEMWGGEREGEVLGFSQLREIL